jgi:hypothetical protein
MRRFRPAALVTSLPGAALAAGALAAAGLALAPAAQASARAPFIRQFHHLSEVASTVPSNGDVNPYGVAVVPRSQGRLHRGDVLVSNFNAKSNLQGTGSTIVQISPGGRMTQFARITRAGLHGAACPGGIGLTTALADVQGWVIVGSLPSADGTAATARAGCLIVLDSRGQVAGTIAGHGINGPWDMTAVSSGHTADLFVTNVLNGTVAAGGKVVHRGTVLRLTLGLGGGQAPRLEHVTKIASHLAEQSNAAAFVLGPTGVGLGAGGTLYIADTDANSIRAIPAALTRSGTDGAGHLVTRGGGLNAPLGLAIAPGGDVLTVNGADGRIVETSPAGMQVARRFLDKTGSPAGSGALFGLAVAPHGRGVYYVDDASNELRLLH